MKKTALGFTLVELLVVITIMAIVGAYAFSNFGSFGEDQKLKSAAQDIQSLLRQAQTNASTGVQCSNGSWQVEFANTTTVNLKCSALPTPVKVLHLDSNISLPSVIGTGWGCPSAPPFSISFEPLTGKMNYGERCTSLTIALHNSKISADKSFTTSGIGGTFYTRPSCDTSGSQLNGLVGYWDFNEGSGTTVADKSGYNNIGTIVSGTSVSTGEIGNARQFTADGDRIVTSSTGILDTDIHSIAFWINFQSTDATWRQIMAYRPSGTDRSPGIWVNRTNLCIHWRYNPGNTGLLCAGPAGENTYFSANTWYYIVGIKNGSTLTFYVNGGQEEEVTVANPKTSGSAIIEFGKTESYNAAYMKLDEVRIYNRALTPAEITSSYNGNAGCSLF